MAKFLSMIWPINILLIDQRSINGLMFTTDAFICNSRNVSYTSAFKTICVEEVLFGYGSSVDIGAKYKVYPSILGSWIANRILKDYDPKREVYMAEARRKTTIEHDRGDKGTAAHYDVSDSQVSA